MQHYERADAEENCTLKPNMYFTLMTAPSTKKITTSLDYTMIAHLIENEGTEILKRPFKFRLQGLKRSRHKLHVNSFNATD